MSTIDGATKTLDILHPLSTLEWEERPSLPVGMCDAQAVVLDGKFHFGGGWTTGNSEDSARVYSYSICGDCSWTTTDTPTYLYALTTYDSHLLLVGGREYPSGQRSNKVYTMTDEEFIELLPPMKEKRSSSSAVTSGSVLVVAGGIGDLGELSSVEVYKDGHWSYGHSLPDACYVMKSTVYNKKWILMGGMGQGTKVFSVSLESLVSGTEQSPWKTLPDVPSQYSAAAVFGGRILSVGGGGHNPTSSIYAYSADSQSWVYAGIIPSPLDSVCAISLQKKLILLGEPDTENFLRMFKAVLKGPTYKRSNDDDDYLVKEVVALEIENEYLKDEVKQLKISLSAAEVLMAESDATIKLHKEKVQQLHSDNQTLLSENQTLRSQLALPAPGPVKTEAPFTSTLEQPKQEIKTEQRITAVSTNLPGVEVVGQTSVTVTNSKLSFHWSGYGFKLHIPQGSLPAGVNQCLLHISASTAGQYQFPDNMELVSAVYWVRCEPFCRFQQPLTAELQHCAKMTSSTNLTFVRAVCSQKDLPYRFKKLEGRGSFTDQSSYGTLQLDRFSGFAVAGEDVERLYIASLYYLIEGLYTCMREIHFVITWDDEAHTNEVKQYFEDIGAKERSYLEIEFKEKSISLDIPMREGVSVDEWKLIPLVPPHLPQRRVDSFKPGKRIPSLQLKATLLHDQRESVPQRLYVVTLQGARAPYNEMVIEIDPFKYRDDQYLAQSTKQLSPLPAFPDPNLIGQLDSGSLSSAVVPYTPPHQHTGYYRPTFPSPLYPSPHHMMHGVHQFGSLGVSGGRSLSIAGPSSDIPKMSFTFENLERELKPVIRWHRLGTNLGIPQETLKAIKLDNPDVDSQKIAFVDLIVRNYQFSWEDICRALENMDESNLATKIRSKYCNKDTAHSESSSQDQPTNSTSPPDDL